MTKKQQQELYRANRYVVGGKFIRDLIQSTFSSLLLLWSDYNKCIEFAMVEKISECHINIFICECLHI